MAHISKSPSTLSAEVEIRQIRARGAGGQNVNKVASSVHLRFDIRKSSLPVLYKKRLLALRDQRITKEGVIIIKARRRRTYENNRQDALLRLWKLIERTARIRKKRRETTPSRASQKRRLDDKTRRGARKTLRKKII